MWELIEPLIPKVKRRYRCTIVWLHQYRDDIHEAFLAIGCSLICLKLLQAETASC